MPKVVKPEVDRALEEQHARVLLPDVRILRRAKAQKRLKRQLVRRGAPAGYDEAKPPQRLMPAFKK